jgi:hypothetical protein
LKCKHSNKSSFTFSTGEEISKCKDCGKTWNSEVLTRTAPLKLQDSHELQIHKIIKVVISRFLPKNISRNHLIAGENGAQPSTTGVADDLAQQSWVAILSSPTYQQLVLDGNLDGQRAFAWATAQGTVLNWRKTERGGLKTLPVSQMNLQAVDPDSNDDVAQAEQLMPWDKLDQTAGDNSNAAFIAGADSTIKQLILQDLKADQPDDYTFVQNYFNREGNASKPDQDRFARIKERLQREYELLSYIPEGVLSEHEAGERYLAKLGEKGGLNAKGKPIRQKQVHKNKLASFPS